MIQNALKGVPLVGEVRLNNTNLLTVTKVRNSLSILGIVMTDSEIVNSIMNTLTSKAGYVSILPLSSKVKASLPEVEKLLDLKKEEMEVIETLQKEVSVRVELNTIVQLLRKEVKTNGVLKNIPSTENKVNKLHEEMDMLFYRLYKGKSFRAGYKRLMIKSALMGLVYSEGDISG